MNDRIDTIQKLLDEVAAQSGQERSPSQIAFLQALTTLELARQAQRIADALEAHQVERVGPDWKKYPALFGLGPVEPDDDAGGEHRCTRDPRPECHECDASEKCADYVSSGGICIANDDTIRTVTVHAPNADELSESDACEFAFEQLSRDGWTFIGCEHARYNCVNVYFQAL